MSTEAFEKEVEWHSSNFDRFELRLDGERSSSFHRLRKEALEVFRRLGFPSTHDEEWRYTNVSPIASTPFELAEPIRPSPGLKEEIAPYLIDVAHHHRLVFLNGFFVPELSSAFPSLPGVKLYNLASLSHISKSPLDAQLGRYADFQNHAFVALNTAFCSDGVVLDVAAGTDLDAPLELLFLTANTQTATISFPRVLAILGESARAAIIESHVSLDRNGSFSNAVSELVAGPNSSLEHTRIVHNAEQAYQAGFVRAELSSHSRFTSNLMNFGASIVRNEINPVLNGEGIECILNGLTAIDGEEHVDNHTQIDHRKPHCFSREEYKGIYGGKSHGVFDGTIIVRPQAQKTNAIQSSQNILLSPDANVDAKPQLKIWADDVKCTHGATVGQLNEDALFYIRSRGLDLHTARQILIHAFASGVINHVSGEKTRLHLEHALMSKLGGSWFCGDCDYSCPILA